MVVSAGPTERASRDSRDYGDSWGGEHTITQTSWVSGGASYTISQFDNEAQFIIAQNGDDNEYNPGLWSRFDWAAVNGDLWYCQLLGDAESEDAALATEAADATNQPKLAWFWLDAVDALAIRGSYGDSWCPYYFSVKLGKGQKLHSFHNLTTTLSSSSRKTAKTMSTILALSRFDWASVDGALWYCHLLRCGAEASTCNAAQTQPIRRNRLCVQLTQLTTPTE